MVTTGHVRSVIDDLLGAMVHLHHELKSDKMDPEDASAIRSALMLMEELNEEDTVVSTERPENPWRMPEYWYDLPVP